MKKKIDNSSKLLQVKFDNEWNVVMEQFNQDNFDYNRYLTLMGVFKFINSDDFNKTTEKLLKDLYSHLTSGDQEPTSFDSIKNAFSDIVLGNTSTKYKMPAELK